MGGKYKKYVKIYIKKVFINEGIMQTNNLLKLYLTISETKNVKEHS